MSVPILSKIEKILKPFTYPFIKFTEFLSPKTSDISDNSYTLSQEEVSKICTLSREVLSSAIINGGTTIRSFEAMGVEGHNQNNLAVYGNEGKPCINCGHIIKRAKIRGRSTYYCEYCQR
jgi:formamidopyrimidine-DNA glycosylase